MQNPPVDTTSGRAASGASTFVLNMTPDGRPGACVRDRITPRCTWACCRRTTTRATRSPARSACRSGRSSESEVTEASVVAVGTPQSFRQQIARALELEADEVGWVQSATAAEELLINAYAPVDVLVLSPEVKEPDALGLAEFVGRTSPGTAIVLVRDHTWNGLLPAAMRAGIRDVVDMTQGTDELREAVERAVSLGREPALGQRRCSQADGGKVRRGHVISVFSSKGGSGKTFLTTNLATAIAQVTGEDDGRGRPRRRHGRRVHLLRPRAVGIDHRPDGARRGRRRRSDPRRRRRGGPARVGVRRATRPGGGGACGRGRSASSCARSAASSTTWWSTRRSTTRTRRSCASTCPT